MEPYASSCKDSSLGVAHDKRVKPLWFIGRRERSAAQAVPYSLGHLYETLRKTGWKVRVFGLWFRRLILSLFLCR